MKNILLLVCVVIGLAHSMPAGAAWTMPKTKQECEARRGKWANFGMPGDPRALHSCHINAPDAGKECKSSGDCLSGLCSPKPGKQHKAGTNASGICAPYRRVNGCGQALENGIVKDLPCTL